MLQDMERPFTLLPAVYHANNTVGNKIVGRNMLRPASSSVVTGKSYCRVSPSDELDHRLAIGVARALGPVAMLRAFTPASLRRLCRDCHRRKTRQDRRLAKFLAACSLDLHGTRRLLS